MNGLTFIVEIGGQFLRWALDGLTEIGKAISWIFDKVLEVANKIIDWVGFLLNWGDIQATHLSLRAVINNGIQSGADHLALVAQKVDDFFGDLEDTVQNALYPAVLTNSVADPGSTQGPIINPEKSTENSVKGNYTNYQVCGIIQHLWFKLVNVSSLLTAALQLRPVYEGPSPRIHSIKLGSISFNLRLFRSIRQCKISPMILFSSSKLMEHP
jgi:hypothetical protein